MKIFTKKKDIEIIYMPSKNKWIKADLQALERIMNNLIDNAFKYVNEPLLLKDEVA